MSQAGIVKIPGSGPGTPVETLQGNTGGKVSPDGTNNINVVGDGTTVNVVGNPGTHTLTISAIGSGGASSFPTDSGTATAVGGVLNINGDPNITTTGSSNIVNVTLDQNIVVTTVSTATPTPIPESLILSGNAIVATGTDTDVGISIQAQGNGPIFLTTASSNVNLQLQPTSIQLRVVGAGPSGEIIFATENTVYTEDANTFTLDNSAASTSGRITFNSSNGPLVFNGQSEIMYDLFNQNTGTGTIAENYSQWSVNTTDATPTDLYSATVTAGNLVTLEATINGISTTTGTDSSFARVWANFAYYAAAGSVVLVGTPVIDFNTTNISTSVTVAVSGSTIAIQVTGITSQAWEWTGVIRAIGTTIV